MSKRTATITFHASHNYGSMLQAYALQQTLIGLGVENEIINFRSEAQKKLYPIPGKTGKLSLRNFIRENLIKILYPNLSNDLKKKYSLFEKFLDDNLLLTKEIENIKSTDSLFREYDYFITGSDQVWNPDCKDFDWAYYLNFTNSPNKIAYASSFGPKNPDKFKTQIISEIKNYKRVSAREETGAEFIRNNTGVDCAILPDPTLLIPKSRWEALAGNDPIITEPYIFVYSPYLRKGLVDFALFLAKEKKLKVVISNKLALKDLIRLRFRKDIIFKYDAGPVEFLNLIKNATFVVCGSFHAIVFSKIFNVPFFAIDGATDNRMRNILLKTNCIDRAVNGSEKESFAQIIFNAETIDGSNQELDKDKSNAYEFLKESLDLL